MGQLGLDTRWKFDLRMPNARERGVGGLESVEGPVASQIIHFSLKGNPTGPKQPWRELELPVRKECLFSASSPVGITPTPPVGLISGQAFSGHTLASSFPTLASDGPVFSLEP